MQENALDIKVDVSVAGRVIILPLLVSVVVLAILVSVVVTVVQVILGLCNCFSICMSRSSSNSNTISSVLLILLVIAVVVLVIVVYMYIVALTPPLSMPLAPDNCRQIRMWLSPGKPTRRAVTTIGSNVLVVSEDHMLGPSCQWYNWQARRNGSIAFGSSHRRGKTLISNRRCLAKVSTGGKDFRR